MTDETNLDNEDLTQDNDTGHEDSGKDESAHIRELRAEAKTRRLQAKKAEKKAQEAETKAQQALQRIDELQKTNNERLIRAELKAQAALAGMIDMDGLKLADLSKVTLDDNGDVQGAPELIKALKETKPYLFKEVVSTSANPDMPKPGAQEAKKAKDMSEAEYKAELAKYGVR